MIAVVVVRSISALGVYWVNLWTVSVRSILVKMFQKQAPTTTWAPTPIPPPPPPGVECPPIGSRNTIVHVTNAVRRITLRQMSMLFYL